MNEPDRPSSSTSAGQLLSAARERWELSVAEVAECLHLSTATIMALEQDEYEDLPGSTFARGYVRAYAKLLKLDEEKIMDCVGLESDQLNEIPATKTSLRSTRHRTWSRKRGGLLFRVLLVAGVLAGLIWFAAYQLSGLDKTTVQEAFKLPGPAVQDEESTPIVPPENDLPDSDESALNEVE